ncbi:hypothetical protein [Cyanobium sp. Morenito 9A2]|uniref:hypothetical protein n=1 Tax=Cyanobium sp. Morenito 9A2 TaxID=2823718 RepID=UPI0020CCC63D|nr:hypothetical protein [Cyanobium sp. Morenito 9A2]MCP9850428.1 hypothetical protein [Cyanobium sp. Morenito 9A2]
MTLLATKSLQTTLLLNSQRQALLQSLEKAHAPSSSDGAAMFDAAMSRLGKAGLLGNNAEANVDTPIQFKAEEDFDRIP